MGAVLFRGDLVLKELAFERMLSPQGRLVEWISAVPGFSSYAKLTMDDPRLGAGHEQFARWCIVTDRVTAKRAGDTLLPEARTAVKAKRQLPETSSPTVSAISRQRRVRSKRCGRISQRATMASGPPSPRRWRRRGRVLGCRGRV